MDTFLFGASSVVVSLKQLQAKLADLFPSDCKTVLLARYLFEPKTTSPTNATAAGMQEETSCQYIVDCV
jgi:hypothetical protein